MFHSQLACRDKFVIRSQILQSPVLTTFLVFEIPIPLVYCKTSEDVSNSLLSYVNDMINAPGVSKTEKKDIGNND